jgi:23S rRNA (guanosine2251-2'-O)-methyltransferase
MKKYIYGINTVKEAFKNSKRNIHRLIVENTSGSKLMDIIKMANRKKINVQFAPKKLMDKISNKSNHQGVIIEIDDIHYYSLDEALNIDAKEKNVMWLAIDSLTDPQNFGSIIRTAVCMGFSSILFSENRSCQITPTVEKIASGAIEKIKFVRVVNLNQSFIYLKEKNFWIYGFDMNGSDVRSIKFNFPIVLVVGSEGEGLHLKTKEHCDEVLRIPQISDFDSLNASIAAAIAMYEVRRRI